MDLPKITDVDVKEKKVIVRGDLDVSKISENDIRLQRLVPTLKFLLDNNARVILIGHRGRPDGKINNEFSLKPVSDILEKMLNTKINFVYDIVGEEANVEANKLQNGQLMMLENLRFDSREETNDPEFVKKLAFLGDVYSEGASSAYVNEAFSVSHREHASIVGIPKHIPHFAGINLANEVENLNKVFEPVRPLVILISGIKKDKLEMVEPLSKLADKVLVGGRLPELMGDKGLESVRLQDEKSKLVIGNLITDKEDVTLNTIVRFKEEIAKAKTIVLAGVLGKYEDEGHSQGTKEIFSAIAASNSFKIVGGGDSLTAIEKYDLTNKFDWVSVGGGAMLEFLTNKTLVGIEALQ